MKMNIQIEELINRLIALRMITQDEVLFDKIKMLTDYIRREYKDPDKAIEILEGYIGDFIPWHYSEVEGRIIGLENCIKNASDSTKLDILLDITIRGLDGWRRRGVGRVSSAEKIHLDIDAQGYYTVARKILEDNY